MTTDTERLDALIAKLEGAPPEATTFRGIQIVASPAVPDDEIWVHSGGKSYRAALKARREACR